MSIKVLKLVDGTEIIGAVSDEVEAVEATEDGDGFARLKVMDTTIEITKPLIINIMPTEQGIRMGLTPFTFSADQGQEIFSLNRSAILCEFMPSAQISNVYREQTSGIVMANNMPPDIDWNKIKNA